MNSQKQGPFETGKGWFYFVVTPGFEDVAEAELRRWWPETPPAEAIRRGRGGIEVELPLAVGLECNHVLKTPTRILLRLMDFGCRDFPKLFRKLSSFAWDEWIGDEIAVDFQVSSHASRLRIKKRIEETCKDARRAFLKKRQVGKTESVTTLSVFVRFHDDVCTVSLDTSGEILHKRGLRVLASEAPLRETLAASLLLLLEQVSPLAEKTGYELVDPMMGGGTFLIEARDLGVRVDSRGFAYQSCLPLLQRLESSPILRRAETGVEFESLVGFEADAKVCAAALENLKRAEGTQVPQPRIETHCVDFMQAETLPARGKRWLVANPPYGERIQVQGRLSEFYESFLAACERVVEPERACFIFPQKSLPRKLRLPKGWSLVGERPFLNGGIAVVAMLYQRRSGS